MPVVLAAHQDASLEAKYVLAPASFELNAGLMLIQWFSYGIETHCLPPVKSDCRWSAVWKKGSAFCASRVALPDIAECRVQKYKGERVKGAGGETADGAGFACLGRRHDIARRRDERATAGSYYAFATLIATNDPPSSELRT